MDYVDKATFEKFFIDNGYVFDFSTDKFNLFCLESIGVELCAKYEQSKGKSLQQYSRECTPSELIKLYTDLINYYEYNCIGTYIDTQEKHSQFEICKSLIARYNTEFIQISTPQIKKIDRFYIENLTKRALKDINEGSFDSALTKARTMLEEVFMYVIEIDKIKPSQKGDIKKLFNQVKEHYKMHADENTDKRIKDLLSGLNKIVDSISKMRNKQSDSHGVGSTRINLKDYHARLFVNSAMTASEFILSVAENANKSIKN